MSTICILPVVLVNMSEQPWKVPEFWYSIACLEHEDAPATTSTDQQQGMATPSSKGAISTQSIVGAMLWVMMISISIAYVYVQK